MSVRISTRKDVDGVTVQIEGRLNGADANDLMEQLENTDSALTLDLSGLLSADHAAVEILKELRIAGASLKGASAYVRYLLDDISAGDGGRGCAPA